MGKVKAIIPYKLSGIARNLFKTNIIYQDQFIFLQIILDRYYLHVVEGQTLELSLIETFLLALRKTVDCLQSLDVLVTKSGSAPHLTTTNTRV